MAVRPIIFSGPMVRALLAGIKTQTRRLITSPLSKCEPGDLLYVRETHYVQSAGYRDGSGRLILYRASTPDAPTTWTPSIHMPRFASRVTLEVTDRRAQKLDWITHEDAVAEGFPRVEASPEHPHGKTWGRAGFAIIWEQLHGAGSWDSNPEVVAITFTVHQANIDDFIRQTRRAA